MDHETSGAQEWQLPGYSRVPDQVRAPATASLSTTTQGPVSRPVQSQAIDVNHQSSAQSHSASTLIKPLSNNVGPGNAFPTRGIRGSRGRGNPSFMRGLSRTSQLQLPSRFPKDSQAKAKWRAGLKPTEKFDLPSRYGTYKHHIIQAGREVLGGTPIGSQGKFEVFEEISQKTGAFVKQPSYNDKEVCVWGEPQQIAAAKDLILQIVKLCNALAYPRKRQDWAKISAHSVTKEDRIDNKEKRQTLTQQLRRAPDSSFKIAEKLLFLWPNGELPMREVFGSELEVLDPIRIEFGYHIYIFEEVPEYICVVGQDHEALREVARRLRTKWHELMATSNVRSKVYLAQPPPPTTMRTGIFVKNIQGLARPSLSGSLLKDFERGPWQERRILIQSKNDARLLSAVERSLRGLPFFRGHLRMRVNIGSFILDAYRLPRYPQTGYSFEEFREMLLHEKTRGRLVPGLDIDQNELIQRCSLASHLLEPLGKATLSLGDVEPKYTVNFEFDGSYNAVLRLEAEFGRHGGAQEYEVAQRRWVKSQSTGRPPLQAVIVDSERADWQLEIRAVEFHDPSNLSPAIQTFNRELAFRKGVALETLSTKPRRRVIIPDWAPVCRVIEKAAVQYRLKGTDYTLEIARYDEYRRNSPSIRMSDVPSSTWGASIFSANWDNLLGQHANVKVGKVASWTPTLNTFFQAREGQDPSDMQAGFWRFISLAKDVAALLGKHQEKSAQTDATNISVSGLTNPKSTDTSSQASSQGLALKEAPKVLDAELGTMF